MTRPYFYMGQGRGLTTLSTGELFFVDTSGSDLSVWILLAGIWETFVDDILCALVRPGDVVLDVGANMGYYTVKLAKRVGDAGHVYAFEPNPRLQGFIRSSLNVNGLWSGFTIVPAAAGAAPGRSTLTFDPAMPGGGQVGLSVAMVQAGQTRLEVPVVRIDDVVPADQVVDLIKIDVEGFEPLVIAGMQAVMDRSPDAAVVIEVAYAHWSQQGDPVEILARFAGDRRMFRIYHDGALEEVDAGQLARSLDQTFVSYVLLLPRTPERWRQIERFVRPRGVPAAPPPQPAEGAAPARGLLRRLRRRIATLIAP